jgi:hypothetical protein
MSRVSGFLRNGTRVPLEKEREELAEHLSRIADKGERSGEQASVNLHGRDDERG